MLRGSTKNFEDRNLKITNWKIIEDLGVKPVGKFARNRPFVIAECPYCKKHVEKNLYSIRDGSGSSKSCGCLKKKSAIERGKKQRTEQGHYISLMKRYAKSAKCRGYEFNLCLDECVDFFTKECYYCGALPQKRTGTQYGKVVPTNGIDRLDSNIGYEQKNCVPCCYICNKMKLNLSLEDFTNHIMKISSYLNSK